MRIAVRRPLVGTSLRGHLALVTCFAILAAVAAVNLPGAAGQGGSERALTQLQTSDALGIGGLTAMRLDGEVAASPAGRADVVAYYGSPRSPDMGILGQHAPEAVADLLRERAATFDDLNGDTHVLPALHLVFAVAQPEKLDGTHLRYVDERTVAQFLALARSRGYALVLDLQIGHSTPLAEITRIERWLAEPDVFVALDPEFALAGGKRPGDAIGSIDASEINAAQWYLSAFVRTHHLPDKLLIVHQFEQRMVTNPMQIERRPGVDIVIDVDGYGSAEIKRATYHTYASTAAFGGIKLFLQHEPDLLSEQALLDLEPRPAFFAYQ